MNTVKYRLGDIASRFFYGTMPRKQDLSERGYPVFSGYKFVGYSNKKNIDQDTLVVVARGVGGTGNVRIAPKDCFLTNLSIAVELNESIADLRYMYYKLTCQGLRYLDSGAAQSQITIENLKTHIVDLPDLPTQHHIASILSAYDDLIENNRRQIKLLEEAAQRLYREWFVELRFPGHEGVKIVDGVPEGWKTQRLFDFADVVMGQSPKSEYYNTDGEGLPFHQGVGTYGYRFVLNKNYSSQYTRVAEAGSILFSVRAPVGRLNYTKEKIAIGRGLAAMNHKDGYQHFLYYMLKEKFFKEDILGNGSIFASITKDELLSQKFTVPFEQIVKLFNEISGKLDRKIEVLDAQSKMLIEARDKLLPKLTSGETEAYP